MAQLISEIWQGLREAGLPEVMLYLEDNSAYRCHWDETTLLSDVRVALLADQERKIVRILPVDSCVGIGIASPKGTDPSGYKSVVMLKLTRQSGAGTGDEEEVVEGEVIEAGRPAPSAFVPPPAPVPEPAPAPKAEPFASRFGGNMKLPTPQNRPGTGTYPGAASLGRSGPS